MTNEEIRLAIGLAIGARWYQGAHGSLHFRFPDSGTQGMVLCDGPLPECSNPKYIFVPDYCNDLNAMHAVEAQLSQGEKMPYARKLLEVVTGCPPHLGGGFLNGGTLWDAVFATAAQRAEAFLRVRFPRYYEQKN